MKLKLSATGLRKCTMHIMIQHCRPAASRGGRRYARQSRCRTSLSRTAHVTDHIHAQLCTHDSTCLSKIIMPALSAACTHYKRRYFKLVNNKLIDSGGGRLGGFAPQGLHVAPIGVKFGVEGRLFRAKFCPKPVQGWSVSPFTKC